MIMNSHCLFCGLHVENSFVWLILLYSLWQIIIPIL